MKHLAPAALSLLLLAGATACTDVQLDDDVAAPSAVEALSGDFSRTLVVADKLYGVDETSVVTYDIADRDQPRFVDRTEVGRAVETIYHHEGNLFIGSRTGMYIYSISRSGVPVRRGDYQYSSLPGLDVEPCDPVVASRSTAYASLYTGDEVDGCGQDRDISAIVVLDVSDVDRPYLVQQHDTPTPRGLAIDGDLLFVCHHRNGLTVFDVSDRENFVELARVADVEAWDAIAVDGRLVVVASTEVVQYDYSDPGELVLLSRTDYPGL